jgi:hydrogenase expression/formation protein HypE
MRKNFFGRYASIIGEITEDDPETVIMDTAIGGKRHVTVLYGEGLPRIC